MLMACRQSFTWYNYSFCADTNQEDGCVCPSSNEAAPAQWEAVLSALLHAGGR